MISRKSRADGCLLFSPKIEDDSVSAVLKCLKYLEYVNEGDA